MKIPKIISKLIKPNKVETLALGSMEEAIMKQLKTGEGVGKLNLAKFIEDNPGALEAAAAENLTETKGGWVESTDKRKYSLGASYERS